MQVEVKFFALARDLAASPHTTLELPEGTTLGEVWGLLADRYPALGKYREEFLLAVNRQFAPPDRKLEPGDVIAVIPPVSGGEGGPPPPVDHYQVREEPLDPRTAIDAVRHPEAGAIVLFLGTVREFTQDIRTLSVDYQAYPEMAQEQLRAIGQEIRRRWDVRGIYIAQRYGHLQPGEESVAISISAPHRADAFAACRHAIDRLKEIVPVWKKEFTSAGSYWVGQEG